MIAAYRNRRRKQQRIAIVNGELRRLSADVDYADTSRAIFRQHRRVG